MSKQFKPTESELEILSILWDKENATVRQVHDIMKENKVVGYTTTLKLMQIMHEKGLVTRDASSKTHVYSPYLGKLAAQELYVSKLIKLLFRGHATALLKQVLNSQTLSELDLADIKASIATLEKSKLK